MKISLVLFVLLLLSFSSASSGAQSGATLARVRARGVLLCGIDRAEAEYSSTDEHGSRVAFDLDLCKAVAIAALGEGAAIRATYFADETTSRQALLAGKVDLVASLTAGTQRESSKDIASSLGLSVEFSAPVLRDPVGLMVPHASGVLHASELSGKKVCFLTETNVEERLHRWFTEQRLDLLPFPFQEEGEMEAAFVTRNCAALGGDLTRLAQTRASTGSRAHGYDLLPETFGDETLAMAYRLHDPQWKALVTGVRDLLVAAAEEGLTSAKAPSATSSSTAGSYPCLARASQLGASLDLPSRWSTDVLRTVGNYAELFERDLGENSPLRFPSEMGVLDRKGGVQKTQR